MTTLLEMDLPDEVVRVAYDTIKAFPSYSRNGVEATIRAALQALVDCGRAEIVTRRDIEGSEYTVAIIRLSPQRKEKEP